MHVEFWISPVYGFYQGTETEGAREATQEEIEQHINPVLSKEVNLAQIDAEYQSKFAELSKSLGMAMLADNTDLVTSIKIDYLALKAVYDRKRGEIIG